MPNERMLEVVCPTCTNWGLFVRKSSCQLRMGVLKPRGAREFGNYLVLYQSLKALHNDWCECYRRVIMDGKMLHI